MVFQIQKHDLGPVAQLHGVDRFKVIQPALTSYGRKEGLRRSVSACIP